MSQAMTEAQAKLIDGVAKALAPKFDVLKQREKEFFHRGEDEE